MEGYNASKVAELIQLPIGFEVAAVISVGYPTPDARMFETVRYDAKDVVFEKKFGNPLPNSYNSDPKM